MPKRDIPSKWLQPTNTEVIRQRWELVHEDQLAAPLTSHVISSQSPNNVDLHLIVNKVRFQNWLLSQGKTKATVKECVNYAKRYGMVLDTGDASILLTLSPRNKHHAMTALANLAKYTGRYDKFMQIKQRYALRWNKADSVKHFDRFFSEELTFDVMLQRIRLMIEKLPPFMGKIIKFACLIGLRPSEVIESVRLINNNDDDKDAYTKYYYYKPERQALEHFAFPNVFLRQTKKAYISFVTPEMLEIVRQQDNTPTKTIPSHNAICLACFRRGIKMDMRFCRKVFASHLRQSGIQSEIVNLLQGRVDQDILTRHYLVPKPTFKEDVLQALGVLKKEIEEKTTL
jgi:intergrase/recombinase